MGALYPVSISQPNYVAFGGETLISPGEAGYNEALVMDPALDVRARRAVALVERVVVTAEWSAGTAVTFSPSLRRGVVTFDGGAGSGVPMNTALANNFVESTLREGKVDSIADDTALLDFEPISMPTSGTPIIWEPYSPVIVQYNPAPDEPGIGEAYGFLNFDIEGTLLVLTKCRFEISFKEWIQ